MRLFRMALLILLILTVFSACPELFKMPKPLGQLGQPGQASGADDLVNEAIAALQNREWEKALSKFSQAVIVDPNNGAAVLGYSLVNLTSLASDPAVVGVMKENLGFVDYPAQMKDVLNISSWIHEAIIPLYDVSNDEEGNEVKIPNGSYYSQFFPRIAGQDDFDGMGISGPADGVVDFKEASMAFAAHYMSHNMGLKNVVAGVLPAFEKRLNDTLTVINKANDDMTFKLSWDMVFDTKPVQGSGGSSWPFFNGEGEPLPLIIGKAELLSMVSGLQVYEALSNLTQAYDLSLPLAEYWAAYNPIDGTFDPTALEKPFSHFLQLNENAEAAYAKTKAIMINAISNLLNAASSFESNRPGFSFSSDPEVGLCSIEAWNDMLRESGAYAFQKRVAQEILLSLKANQNVIIPSVSEFYENGWPETFIPGESTMYNFGILFGSPVNLLSGFLSMGSEGEPVFYVYNAENMKFDILDAALFASYYPGYDMSSNNPDLKIFTYMPDYTIGGAFPLANISLDDPNTGLTLSNLYWNDYNSDYESPAYGNALWEPGEKLTTIDIGNRIEGAINIKRLSEYPGNDPFKLFANDPPDFTLLSDAELARYTLPENIPALRMEIEEHYDETYHISSINSPVDIIFIDGTSAYLQNSAIFPEIVFHSVTPKGTSGTGMSGGAVTSTGSAYWYFFNEYNKFFKGEPSFFDISDYLRFPTPAPTPE